MTTLVEIKARREKLQRELDELNEQVRNYLSEDEIAVATALHDLMCEGEHDEAYYREHLQYEMSSWYCRFLEFDENDLTSRWTIDDNQVYLESARRMLAVDGASASLIKKLLNEIVAD